MCGIFGIVIPENQFTFNDIKLFSNNLFLFSESRGKESAGIAVKADDAIRVFKSPFASSRMIRNPFYKKFLEKTLIVNGSEKYQLISRPVSLIGHSRLVTNGSQENHKNNQPVIKDGIVAVHNGIIVNDAQLWTQFPDMQRLFQVDTEVILSLITHFYEKSHFLLQAIKDTYSLLEGYASMAFLFNNQDILALTTNNGSLYVCFSEDCSLFGFSSEEYILKQSLKKSFSSEVMAKLKVQQVKPGMGLFVNLLTLKIENFTLANTNDVQLSQIIIDPPIPIQDVTPQEIINSAKSTFTIPSIVADSIYKKFGIEQDPILALRRCSLCLLPETMPFIEFDAEGVCNYCRSYQKLIFKGHDELVNILDQYRRADGSPDCIITFSGGRDSSFALHYVKTKLNMHPIAYTYDWGMITDLGRRNQARLCGKLGIEHILISADINQKREYIRKNVLAWLKRPHLGTVPLFMAGDKQYFYYANKIKKQMGINLIILADNPLEETFFKFGFCGLPPSLSRPTIFDQFKLASFYSQQFLINPAFINSSLFDTLGAFASYYIIPHDYLRFYQYIPWNEEKIDKILYDYYNWEVASDTKTTWRIGDGTAAFYNYIYYSVAGFTENDTFRSNQIREGVLSRSAAIDIVNRDNQPRFESIQWYCNTIGIDMTDTLNRINQIPKLYVHAQK